MPRPAERHRAPVKKQKKGPPYKGERLGIPGGRKGPGQSRTAQSPIEHLVCLERAALSSKSVPVVPPRVLDNGSHNKCQRSEGPSPGLQVAQYDASLRGEHALGEQISHSISGSAMQKWRYGIGIVNIVVGQGVVQAPGECLRFFSVQRLHGFRQVVQHVQLHVATRVNWLINAYMAACRLRGFNDLVKDLYIVQSVTKSSKTKNNSKNQNKKKPTQPKQNTATQNKTAKQRCDRCQFMG